MFSITYYLLRALCMFMYFMSTMILLSYNTYIYYYRMVVHSNYTLSTYLKLLHVMILCMKYERDLKITSYGLLTVIVILTI